MITTSPDGQWAAVRRGREVSLLAAGAGPATSRLELETDDADLVIVGPPSVLAIVTRGPGPKMEGGGFTPSPGINRIVLYQPPYLEAVARLDLDTAMQIAAVTGPRVALVSRDGKAVTIVRIAGRAMSSQALETGSPVEFAVGLERNQILFGLLRKLEAWDAVSGRPLLRMQLQLPPPPRTVGPAHGHVWATRPGSDVILVWRLSDGRPFRHQAGAPIDEVICHAASPLLILVTERGLVRLHCFAHSLTVIDAPWQPGMALAQLVVGEDINLLGLAPDSEEPWRVPIGGSGAPAITLESSDAPSEPPLATAADKLRAMRERTHPGAAPDGDAVAVAAPPAAAKAGPATAKLPAVLRTGPTLATARPAERTRAWRDPLAAFGAELARGAEAELPVVAVDTELGQLAHHLQLPSAARRALIALYGLYLVGEPGLSIARLAHVLGDWPEPLGQGELGALALVRRRGGRIALRGAVSDVLDGVGPRAVRLVGDGAAAPRAGAFRLERDDRPDAVLETELAEELGRIAVIEGGCALAVLEARLRGATAVAFSPPPARPVPWPRDAALIVIAPARPDVAWVGALPRF
jgi:hypothetical protein